MPKKLLFQLLLGFFLSSIYLVAFALTVRQQQTSYLSLTQAHSPERLVNISAEKSDGRTLKASAATDRPHRRY